MYEFARSFLDNERALFLRANRGDDGARNFRLEEAKPLPKSFGADLYERIFESQTLRVRRDSLSSDAPR